MVQRDTIALQELIVLHLHPIQLLALQVNIANIITYQLQLELVLLNITVLQDLLIGTQLLALQDTIVLHKLVPQTLAQLELITPAIMEVPWAAVLYVPTDIIAHNQHQLVTVYSVQQDSTVILLDQLVLQQELQVRIFVQ